jgi:hypothetical protein
VVCGSSSEGEREVPTFRLVVASEASRHRAARHVRWAAQVASAVDQHLVDAGQARCVAQQLAVESRAPCVE